ncbi:hypothetical protein ACWGJP_09855 [Microbacterium sp. NPDC055903]
MSSPYPNDDPAVSVDPAVETTPVGVDDGDVLYEDQVAPEFGILGFTLRELIIVGVWLVAFVTSFFPLFGVADSSIWNGVQWVLPIGVPTAAVFLIVLRRFSPDGIRRVGSLGIDQFASVAFSVATVYWIQLLWAYIGAAMSSGAAPVAWVPWVQVVTMLALVVLTVFAPFVPGIREDFRGRLETLAHRSANPVRPVIPRPREPKAVAPAAAAHEPLSQDAPADQDDLAIRYATDEIPRLDLSEQVPLSAHASGGELGASSPSSDEEYAPAYARRSRRAVDDTDADDSRVVDDLDAPEAIAELGFEPAGETGDQPVLEEIQEPVVAIAEDTSTHVLDVDATNPRTPSSPAQPFWALAPTERDVVDERGEPIFRIGPTAWALVIEDRGGAFVVRHDDGRIGYLHDIADITKG